MSAGILISARCRQVSTGSPQASTVKVQSPSTVGVTSALHRSSAPVGRIGVETRRPSGPRRTTVALTASWPSRNTVADTVNVSPTTHFTGRVPSATTGDTSSTA